MYKLLVVVRTAIGCGVVAASEAQRAGRQHVQLGARLDQMATLVADSTAAQVAAAEANGAGRAAELVAIATALTTAAAAQVAGRTREALDKNTENSQLLVSASTYDQVQTLRDQQARKNNVLHSQGHNGMIDYKQTSCFSSV